MTNGTATAVVAVRVSGDSLHAILRIGTQGEPTLVVVGGDCCGKNFRGAHSGGGPLGWVDAGGLRQPDASRTVMEARPHLVMVGNGAGTGAGMKSTNTHCHDRDEKFSLFSHLVMK